MIFHAVRQNLGRLTQYSGREKRDQFWLFAGCVIALSMIALIGAMLPEILESLTKMQQFASEHPEMAHVERSPTSYAITIRGRHPELMPNMVVLVGVMAVIFSKVTVLLAAAVTRRLHDCDKAGWWGIMPLPFVAFGLVAMPKLFAQPTPDTRLFFVLLLNNMLYIAALAWLVALLSGEGTKGANRYGQRP